ncbi:hypothetical protein [Leptolyngbya sp. PCC 6406]|uniref:hypothetical protein n=1 Tax=Leptolyngbya sp. PCC 6406 TaxID=1173264 RepID=UPI0002AD02BB|nr:hypothetical protein [Leptolyngbya sp. PCC 6406]
MDLIGDSQALAPQRKRVDGAIVNKRFTQSIWDNGGAGDVFQRSVVEETRELFDCTVNDLYRETGAKKGCRETLPQAAQEAYMVNESLAANELERQVGTIGGESQDDVNDRIVTSVRQVSKNTRRWLPW